jgi:hypothetical protein
VRLRLFIVAFIVRFGRDPEQSVHVDLDRVRDALAKARGFSDLDPGFGGKVDRFRQVLWV